MPSKNKILVTGANGQLAQEIKKISGGLTAFDFVFLSKEDLAIHQSVSVKEAFRVHTPSYCINCAAYTAVDKAETEKDLARQINAEAVGVLAVVCKEYGTKLVHISTDYVFNGNGAAPYTVDSPVNPQNVYGATKLEGERLAMQNNPETIIIRTSWVYSEFGKNFVKTMIRLMAEKDSINVVNDQVGSPTYAADLAEAILQIIQSGKWKGGIYHFSNTGIISWYDFANGIKEIIGSACQVNPIPTSQYPTPAKRPGYSAMDASKMAEVFGIRLKDWKESLAVCLKVMRDGQ